LVDITKHKRAEEALMEERHFLHTLMDNLPDMIYFKDRGSRFTRINQAHAKEFGLRDPAQAVGKTDFDFFGAEHAQEAFEDEQEIIRTGRPLVDKEEREIWPDGQVTWVATTKMPLRDTHGDVVGTFGVSRDITDRKRAENDLRLTQFSMEHASDNVYWVDPHGRVVFVNEAACRSLGRTREEILALSISDIDPLIPKEAWEKTWEQLKTRAR
jgi:PAS domain S-box-containing protein